ncbi:hypothetical protein ACWCRF_13870, partial [Streptomyces sp. NPDC002405]
TSTGDTAKWQSQTFPITNPGGKHKIYLVFRSTAPTGVAAEGTEEQRLAPTGRGGRERRLRRLGAGHRAAPNSWVQ